jgi:hypothetical protein
LRDEAWLLDRRGQRLFHLNPMATFIWSAHLAGLPEREIARMMSSRFGLTPTLAGGYVSDALRQAPPENREEALPDEAEAPICPPAGAARAVETYTVLDLTVRLGFDTYDMHRRVHSGLAWLAAAEPPAGAQEWRLAAADGGFVLIAGGRVIDRCGRADGVAPMVKVRLLTAALDASRDAFAIHAAALGAGSRCLLIPGRSGAGKSTLSARLASDGLSFLGDDTAVLTDGTPRVRPLPLPIALKPGSWPLLRDRTPGLLDLPVHWRADGKAVRYWIPPAAARPTRRALPVGWIVFPAFAPGSAAALYPLSAEAALKRLSAGLAPLGAGLTPDKLDRLIAWADRVPAFELRFGALDDASHLLSRLGR